SNCPERMACSWALATKSWHTADVEPVRFLTCALSSPRRFFTDEFGYRRASKHLGGAAATLERRPRPCHPGWTSMKSWISFVVRMRFAVVLLCVLLTGWFATQIP